MDGIVNDMESIKVIAEVANTHNGSLLRAKTIIDKVALVGVNIIKFQIFCADDLIVKTHADYTVFKRLEFSLAQWKSLLSYASKRQLNVYCDIFHHRYINFLMDSGCCGLKIHSSDISNYTLLSEVGKLFIPVLLSVGGTTPKETWKALDILFSKGCTNVTLMVGFQSFPTSLNNAKLGLISWYKEQFGLPVGYADHTDADDPMANIVPLLAIAAGATIIEKHITYKRKFKPDDYESSIEPKQFESLITQIKRTSEAIGGKKFCKPSPEEKAYSDKMKKYPISSHELPQKSIITGDDYKLLRVENVIDVFPAEIDFISGKKTSVCIPENKIILHKYINNNIAILLSARVNSSRLPNKAFANIIGKPSIEWLIERLKKCNLVSKIIICTTKLPEDDVFLDLAEKHRIHVFRGAENDVMGRFIQAIRHFNIDIIVRVTGDDIFRDPEYIDLAIEKHLVTNAEYTKTVGLPDGIGSEVISSYALEWIYSHIDSKKQTEYMSWFLDQPDYLRVSYVLASPKHQRSDLRLTLDTPEDLQFISWIINNFVKEKRYNFSLTQIIDLIDSTFVNKENSKRFTPTVRREDVNISFNFTHSKLRRLN